MAEAVQAHLELVAVEADGHVELEAGADDGAVRRDVAGLEGEDAGGRVGEYGGADGLQCAVDGDEDGAGDRLGDAAQPGRVKGAVLLDEREGREGAVADAERLVEGSRRSRRRARAEVRVVLPAEAEEAAATLLEEGDDGVKVIE